MMTPPVDPAAIPRPRARGSTVPTGRTRMARSLGQASLRDAHRIFLPFPPRASRNPIPPTKTQRHKGTPLALCLCVRTLCVLVLEFLNFTRLTTRHQVAKAHRFFRGFVHLCENPLRPGVRILEFHTPHTKTPRHEDMPRFLCGFVPLCENPLRPGAFSLPPTYAKMRLARLSKERRNP